MHQNSLEAEVHPRRNLYEVYDGMNLILNRIYTQYKVVRDLQMERTKPACVHTEKQTIVFLQELVEILDMKLFKTVRKKQNVLHKYLAAMKYVRTINSLRKQHHKLLTPCVR